MSDLERMKERLLRYLGGSFGISNFLTTVLNWESAMTRMKAKQMSILIGIMYYKIRL